MNIFCLTSNTEIGTSIRICTETEIENSKSILPKVLQLVGGTWDHGQLTILTEH